MTPNVRKLALALLMVPLAACGDDDPKPADADADVTDLMGGDADDAVEVDGAIDIDEDTAVDTGVPPVDEVRVWKTFEATLDLPVDQENPFDPAEIAVTATFDVPDGPRYVVNAFVDQAFTRALVEGREQLTPVGERVWKVRFRPPSTTWDPPLSWRWRWEAVTPAGTTTSDWMTYTPERDVDGHGHLVRSDEDARYLVFEDGAPYFAIGENMAWAADGRGTFAYDDWMQDLADAGGTYIRVWMPSWGFGIEWEGSLGNYGSRLDRAWQLDRVFERASELGLQVMLTIQNHGPFSSVHAEQWDDNPYNAANGGPLEEPTAFFTNEEARELFARRLRYLVARWGHETQLLAWELWNEVDLVEDPTKPAVREWHEAMARELDRLDVHDHLVTTSFGGVEVLAALLGGDVEGLKEKYGLWSLPELDFTQLHFYGFDTVPTDFVADLRSLAEYLHAFGKPALIAEAGPTPVGAPETMALDPNGTAFHAIVWAGLFAETFGTGMVWWWDHITDPENWYFHFRGVAEVVEGVRFAEEGFVRADDATAGTPTVELRAHALVGETVVVAWIDNPRHQWFDEDATTFADAVVTVPGVAAGAWRVRWIDPWGERGAVEESVTVVEGVPVELAVPAFGRDVALRLDRVGGDR